MHVQSWLSCVIALSSMLVGARVEAAVRPCDIQPNAEKTAAFRLKIVAKACKEHADWYAPFINEKGRVGWGDGSIPMEAEQKDEALANGDMPWQRVAEYWRGVPLSSMRGIDGARECEAPPRDWRDAASCRAFILDNPWSAAFVSYVMRTAGVESFGFSHEHIAYIRDASDPASPRRRYRMVAPDQERPELGDLLCYVRGSGIKNHRMLVDFLARGGDSLKTHCDIVIGVNLNGDSKLYVIGGNVMQTVMMRKLSLNEAGLFSPPERKKGVCRINEEQACSLSMKTWVALLKLQD